ncbi:MAG: hypothetical protein GY822_29880 [Deltaproteobacteria bacterium]|nr:hypothetical protein [Deltaproteobacteria bacterium]
MEMVIMIATAVGVSIGLAIVSMRQRKGNASLAPTILEKLASQPRTLPNLANELGMGSFMARGKVAMALNQLVAEGLVALIPAPSGTPQMQKVNHIEYRLAQSAED